MSMAVVAILAHVTLLTGSIATAQEDSTGGYELGAGDRIALRVVLWDEEIRRYDTWTAISGDYTVQSDGSLRLPLGGRIAVAGRTTDAVSDDVSRVLQSRIDSVEPPGVGIEVTEYRPFFVLGEVNEPGAFPARPGLTVLQAVALSGGERTSLAGTGSELSALRDGGTLRQTMIDMARSQVRAARLRAEIAGDTEITFPEDLTHPEGPEALADAIAEESNVFQSRASGYSLEVANLNELKQLLTTEIASLEEKFSRYGDQIDLGRSALERIEKLRESGLASVNQQASAQRQLFDLESQELDLQTALYRSQQRIKEADRDLVALRTRRIIDATTELQAVATDLERMQARMNTLRALIAETGASVVDMTGQEAETEYRLTPDGAAEEITVGAGRRIAPGDTLRVLRQLASE